MKLEDMTCEELREMRDTLLRWIERRGSGAPNEKDVAVLHEYREHLKDIEAEIAKRCD